MTAPDDLSWMNAPPIRPSAWHIQRHRRRVRLALFWVLAAVMIGGALGAKW